MLSGNDLLHVSYGDIEICLLHKKDSMESLVTLAYESRNVLEATCEEKTEVHSKRFPLDCVANAIFFSHK